MKAYLVTTGVLFALLTMVHIWRAASEGMQLAGDPWYILTTVVGAVMSGWALRLLRASRQP